MQVGTLGIVKKVCSDGWTIVQLLTGSMIEADQSNFIPTTIHFESPENKTVN
jgi:hypothetical protein